VSFTCPPASKAGSADVFELRRDEFLPYCNDGNRVGKSRDKEPRAIGRHAQIIAVLASIMLHKVDMKVPCSWSSDFEDRLRVVIRIIVVTQTLCIDQ
jgi:hypothetical protein